MEEKLNGEINSKGRWGHQLESTLSLIGYSVGLGNFWRFPYLCMMNGGGAFIIPYMTFMVLCGLPLFYLELSVGQFSGNGPLTSWEICPLFKGVGWGMVAVSAICSIYFIVIITWGVYFLGISLRSDVPWKTCDNEWNTENCIVLGRNITHLLELSENSANSSPEVNISILYSKETAAEEFWRHRVLDISDGIEDMGFVKWDMTICLLVTWLMVYLCLCKGIRSSGKAVYVTVPLPYIMLTLLLIRGITLPGSLDGIKYYVIPDWSKLATFKVWTGACIQVFYTLGATWGGLHTMASYNRFNNNCLRDALVVTFTCSGTSIYAGFAIFATLGYMAHTSGIPLELVVRQGPGLAFVGYPEALATLPVSPLWAVFLFLAVISLGIDGEFGMVESVITGIVDEFPKYLAKRKYLFGALVCLTFFLLDLPFVTQGGMYLFLLVDWYLAVVCLLVFGFLECIVIGYIYGIGNFYEDITIMSKTRPSIFWAVCWCGVIPLLLVGMLIINCGWVTPPVYGDYTYPHWAVILGWLIAVAPVVPIPVVAAYKMATTEGTYSQRLVKLLQPSSLWRPQAACESVDAYRKLRSVGRTWSERMTSGVIHSQLDVCNTDEEKIPMKLDA